MNYVRWDIVVTAWKVSKYGPEKTPYLDTFHSVSDSWYAHFYRLINILTKQILKVCTSGCLLRFCQNIWHRISENLFSKWNCHIPKSTTKFSITLLKSRRLVTMVTYVSVKLLRCQLAVWGKIHCFWMKCYIS